MHSVLFGGLANDPNEILDEKSKEWCNICQCDSVEARRRVIKVIKEARSVDMAAQEPSQVRAGTETAQASQRFNKNTSTGIDKWPLS